MPNCLRSSSAGMMIFGLMRISSVCSSRTFPRLVNARLRMGILLMSGTPISRSISPASICPPSSSVPPSGTVTVDWSSCTVTFGSWRIVSPREVIAVMLFSVEICGRTVRVTYRRSAETVASTSSTVPVGTQRMMRR